MSRSASAISSAIKKRRKRRESTIEQIRIAPLKNNSMDLFTTVRCGIHRDNKTGRMRYRRLNVWVNNRLVLEGHCQPHAGAKRAMTDPVLIKNVIDVERLANAIEANAESMPFVVRVEAMCETYDDRNGRFTGRKKHRKSDEIFGTIELDLVAKECWKYLKSCEEAMSTVDENSVEIVSFRSPKRNHVGGCPVNVPFIAKIRTEVAVSGRAWLKYEDGSRSRDHDWKMRRAGKEAANMSRRISGKPGDRKNGWVRLVVSWEGSDCKKHSVQSGKVDFRTKCNVQASGGGSGTIKLQ